MQPLSIQRKLIKMLTILCFRYGTFATGGADGVVNFWDRVNRKRIRQLPKYHSPISSMSFNRDGQLLALAASYGYEEGERDHHPDSIFVRAVEDSDIKPKSAHP